MKFDDDIWTGVKPHPWKYRKRDKAPMFVELHSTRGGQPNNTAAMEYSATINWSLSPHNRNNRMGDDWASMESFIVGGGKVCRVLPDDYWPHYSLGHADPYGFSIEMGQSLNTIPFDPRDIENAARLCADLSKEYNIPVRVLPYLSADNHEGGGYVRHDRSANGTYYGKTDPGQHFNDAAFIAIVERWLGIGQEDDDMQILGHFADKATGYAKSYLVFADKDGKVKKQHVTSAAENQALAASGWPVKALGNVGAIPDAP